MSRDLIPPCIVDRDDTVIRRAAAFAVFKAYLTAPQSWTYAAVVALLDMGLTALLIDNSVIDVAYSGLSIFVVAGVLYASITAVFVYLVPRGVRRELCYLRTDQARAVLVLTPDHRHGALEGDVQGTSAAAWPKRHGAGADLGRWARDRVHAGGGRITLTATPWMASVYRRHDLIDDGRTARWMVRLASRPRVGSQGVAKLAVGPRRAE